MNRKINIIGLVFVIGVLLFAGCSKNYTGQYLFMQENVRTITKDSKGRVVESPIYIIEGYSYHFIYDITKYILNIKQEKSDISGNFIITDDKSLIEFKIRSGYIDKDNKLHLKLTWKPDMNVGFSFFGISASGSLGEYLLNFDEVSSTNNTLKFKITGSVSIFEGLIADKVSNSEEFIVFEKYSERDTEDKIKKLKDSKAADELKVILSAIASKNLPEARKHKELLESLSGKLDEQTLQKFNELNDYFTKYLPQLYRTAYNSATEYYAKNIKNKRLDVISDETYEKTIKLFDDCLNMNMGNNGENIRNMLKHNKLIKAAIESIKQKDFDKAISYAKQARKYYSDEQNWEDIFRNQKNITEYSQYLKLETKLDEPIKFFSDNKYHYAARFSFLNEGKRTIRRIAVTVRAKDKRNPKIEIEDSEETFTFYSLNPGNSEGGKMIIPEEILPQNTVAFEYEIKELEFENE